MSIDNPVSILFDTSGVEMAVQDAVVIPAGTRALLFAGRDGTTARVPLVDSSARFIVAGAGVAGTPAGGVVSIQGVASGTVVPISVASLPLPAGAAQEHVTAASPHATRLSDGSAFYDAVKTAQLPSALVGGRLDVNTGAWLGSTAPTVGQKAMAASLPVVIASDQSTLAISAAALPLPAGAAQEHVTAGSPHAVRLTDGSAFYAAPVTAQFPSALVGGRFDVNLGTWLGATTPTVGQKTMAASLPVVLASDQTTIAISAASLPLPLGAAQEHVIAGSPNSVRLSDGSAFYDGAKTGQLPSALVGGRLDQNLGAWLGSTAPTVGQKAMAASLPVVLASDQGPITVTGSITATDASVGVVGAAVPGSATQIGATDGTNLQSLRAFDADTGAGSEFIFGVSLRKSASGGSVELGTSSDPVRVDPTGTTAQPVTDNGGSLTVDSPQLPSGLVGGRFDINVGAWLTSTAPTVGQKAMAASLPVVISSDQTTLAISAASLPLPAGAAQEHVTAGSFHSARLTDGSSFYDAAKTGQFPSALVSGRLDINLGSWLGSTTPTTGQKAMVNSLPVVLASDQTTIAISAASLPLPAGAAQEHATAGSPHSVRLSDGSAFYDGTKTGQLPTTLVGGRLDINTGSWLGSTTPTVGQKTSASSLPVVVSSDQSTLPVKTEVQLDFDTTGSTQNLSMVGVALPSATGAVIGGTSTNPFRVDPTGTTAQPVTDNGGSLTVDSTQLPAALVGGRLDQNIGAWLTSTAPTVGQKAMAASIPVVLASDQTAITITGSISATNPSVSTTGAAIPASATFVGGSDGTNLQGARVFDADTGGGTQYVLGAVLRKSASGGSVEAGTSSDPLRTDPTGATAQPITDNGGSLTVDSTQLPAALVGGRLDSIIGSWMGSTAPTVGQKTASASLPVVLASDQAPDALARSWFFKLTNGTNTATVLPAASMPDGSETTLVVAVSPNSIAQIYGVVDQGGAAPLIGAWPMLITDGTDVAGIAASGQSASNADPALVVALSPNTPIEALVDQGAPTGLLSQAWPVKLTDGTTAITVKAASTAAVAADTALVTSPSPNSVGPVQITTPLELAAGIFATSFPAGYLRTTDEPRQVMYDPFDGSALDSQNWAAPVAIGGGVAAASAAGSLTLSAGTTASGYSYLQSNNSFRLPIPGWLGISMAVAIESPVTGNTYRFWGQGTPRAAPTVAAPILNGAGFELGTDGKLRAVVYSNGTQTVVQDLSTSGNSKQPTDANFHRYIIYVRTDRMFWYIDSLDVPVATSSFQSPQIQTLPDLFLAIANSAAPSGSGTITCAGIANWDTAKNNTVISDGTYGFRKAVVKAPSTAPAATDSALVVAISPNNAGPQPRNNSLSVAVAFDQAVTVQNPFLEDIYDEIQELIVEIISSIDRTVPKSATGSDTMYVNASTTAVLLLDANPARMGATFYNESTSTLKLKLGPGAAAANYTVQVVSGAYYELPFSWKGAVTGLWAAANAGVLVTELH